MQRRQSLVEVAAMAQAYWARVAVHGISPCWARAICFACSMISGGTSFS